MADALDSGSSGSYPVRVQVPFSALNENPGSLVIDDFRDSSLLNIQKLGKDRAHQTYIYYPFTYLQN